MNLENYLQKYNDEFEEREKLGKEFSRIFMFIDKCRLPQDSRAWRNKADLFTLLVERSSCIELYLMPEQITRFNRSWATTERLLRVG